MHPAWKWLRINRISAVFGREFGPNINIAFTDYSRPCATMHSIRKGHPNAGIGDWTKMAILKQITVCAVAVREFIAPTYRPEKHYMRGPGPACARVSLNQRPTVH